ncbi:host attachment family protein [Sphingomonas canadensis]|uniref:Host attachment family protein n=1 Tax=Sphingomonas canadensis TaxID=1219257 RepID=A0ABW3HC99_9SPHN|nr:host attachment family protein [Sphingomonas canadensis]MCW3837731.1 host attachment family protein [Sphingomonas canadensis]
MELPHDTAIVIADGRKLLFLRNAGDARYPDLRLELKRDAGENPPTHEQATDLAGRAMGTRVAGGQWGSGTIEPADYHQIAEDRFAAEAAAMLNAGALAGEFERLVVVAPPETLGELRRHYDRHLTERLASEIAKDLTRHTIPEIEKLLLAE